MEAVSSYLFATLAVQARATGVDAISSIRLKGVISCRYPVHQDINASCSTLIMLIIRRVPTTIDGFARWLLLRIASMCRFVLVRCTSNIDGLIYIRCDPFFQYGDHLFSHLHIHYIP